MLLNEISVTQGRRSASKEIGSPLKCYAIGAGIFVAFAVLMYSIALNEHHPAANASAKFKTGMA
jgi:hypothetical protein